MSILPLSLVALLGLSHGALAVCVSWGGVFFLFVFGGDLFGQRNGGTGSTDQREEGARECSVHSSHLTPALWTFLSQMPGVERPPPPDPLRAAREGKGAVD